MEKILELREITKSFGETRVLRGISLDIYKGEFITILGSSGCGKTTTLRIIAGLETPDSGQVVLCGQDVTHAQPNHRDVNTIFQNYALFPHMNVAANIAYALKLRKTPAAETKRRVEELLELVLLPGYGKRMPGELSGGQRQRVAIARALAARPSVLLLDEPLGALDLQLRRQMQQELKKLQKQLGITFVYITHDQEEAINMSDRIVVMNDGRLEQVGSPSEIYDHPRTSFVAGFIGTANMFTGVVQAVAGDLVRLRMDCGSEATVSAAGHKIAPGQTLTFSVRSENIQASTTPVEGFAMAATVAENSYVGGMLRIAFTLSADCQGVYSTRHGIHRRVTLGDKVYLSWDPENASLVDMED